MLTACGSPVPRKDMQNLPSLIEIVALNLKENSIKLRVSHRNRATRENNQLSCQLAIKDFEPIQLTAIVLPDLTNYATETIETNIAIQQFGQSLQSHQELAYVLDCFLFSSNFRKEHIIKKSFVYQTPGERHLYR
jgi:hypothetical protein